MINREFLASAFILFSGGLLFSVPATAATFQITNSNSLFTNVGNYSAVAGATDTVANRGRALIVAALGGGDPSTTRSIPASCLWQLLANVTVSNGCLLNNNNVSGSDSTINTTRTLVFGLGINQSGGQSGFLDLTGLNITLQRPARLGGGTLNYTLGANNVQVFNYDQGGASNAEARFQLNLPFDFMTTYNANSTENITFNIAASNNSQGEDTFFLSTGFTQRNIPAPVPANADPIKLFHVEGRAGAPGREDYEWAIGPRGANAANTGQIYRDWNDGEVVRWCLQWNPSLKRSTFFLAASSSACTGTAPLGAISYTSPIAVSNPTLDLFEFVVYSKQATSVNAGTTMRLIVDTANGSLLSNPYNLLATAGSSEFGAAITPFFVPAVTSLSGTVTMDWGAINPNAAKARSRVGFQIKGFDPPVTGITTSDDPLVSTPEPNLVLSFAALLGTGWLLRRNRRN